MDSRMKISSRSVQAVVIAALGALGFGSAVGADETRKPRSLLESIELNHLSLNLEKVERAETFYRTVFGMTPVDHGRRGNDRFLHFQEGFLNMRPSSESSINHFCFSIKDYEPNVVYQMVELLETDPFFMGPSVHCYDPDRFNVQIQEGRHGWGRINGAQLTDADKGLFKTVRIHHLSFNVTDVKESVSFYAEVFGAVPQSASANRALMKVGENSFLELLKSDRAGINHYCFAVEDFDAETAKKELDLHVPGEISSPETGVLRLADPNGILLEVTSPQQAMK